MSVTPVADNFNRADTASGLGSTSTGAAPWIAVLGTMGISSNSAYAAAPASGGAIATVDVGSADHYSEVRVVTADAGTAALVRCSGAQSWYSLNALTSGQTGVYKDVAGTLTLIASPGPWTSGDVLGIQASGSTLTFYKNGVQQGSSVTDTSLTTGNPGITCYSTTGRLDDFAAHALTGGATPSTVAPNDAGIAYSPYNWDVTSARAATINPGAYLRFAVANATALTLNFDMTAVSSPVPRIKARVDSGTWTTYDLAATVALTLPSDNTWATHTVEVVVAAASNFVTRWSPQNTMVKLTGITCTGTSVATRAAVKAPLNVLVFGDSITEGYDTLKNVTTPDGSDSTVSYAYPLRALLGVELGVVGFGGQGWVTVGNGGVPALPTAYGVLWSGGPSRSLTAPAPDLIVINQGQNDGTAATTGTITAFLNTLLSAAPSARIAVMRPFSGGQATNLQAGIAACSAPSRVTYIDTTGWLNASTDAPYDGVHPSGFASQATLGPQLANAIRSAGLLGSTATSKRFVNVGGVARPIGTVIKG